MELKAFPPADAFFQMMMNIDYKKHLNSFLDAVVIACAFVAAIATVIYDTWMKYNMTERVQLWSLTAYTWTRKVAVPAVIKASTATYNAGVNIRQFYDMINSPLFITL